MWEKQATDFIDENTLYPFIPLMEGGLNINIIEEADKKLYEDNSLNPDTRADLLIADG